MVSKSHLESTEQIAYQCVFLNGMCTLITKNTFMFWKSCTGITSLLCYGRSPHQKKCSPRLSSVLDLWGGMPCQVPAVWWGCRRSALVWVTAQDGSAVTCASMGKHHGPWTCRLGPSPSSAHLRIQQRELHMGCETVRCCWKMFAETANPGMWDACSKANGYRSWSRRKS